MFDKAITENASAKPIFHSDRGFQYTNKVFKRKIEGAGMTQSMSRPGKCLNNGPMEGFFGTLKVEMFDEKKFDDYNQLIEAINKYITYYNNGRFQANLKDMTPYDRIHASV